MKLIHLHYCLLLLGIYDVCSSSILSCTPWSLAKETYLPKFISRYYTLFKKKRSCYSKKNAKVGQEEVATQDLHLEISKSATRFFFFNVYSTNHNSGGEKWSFVFLKYLLIPTVAEDKVDIW